MSDDELVLNRTKSVRGQRGIVIEDLRLGPPCRKQAQQELDGKASPFDDRLAEQYLGIGVDVVLPTHRLQTTRIDPRGQGFPHRAPYQLPLAPPPEESPPLKPELDESTLEEDEEDELEENRADDAAAAEEVDVDLSSSIGVDWV